MTRCPTVLLLFFFLITSSAGMEGGQKLLPGKLIRIKCQQNPSYSYSIYLPSYYNEKNKYPVVFVFDPAARDSLAVDGFIDASEKRGYIIACTADSRNGLPWEEVSKAINLVSEDVLRRCSVDMRRICTAGFSGGARVASALALQNSSISGVIACGAGFPDNSLTRTAPSFDFIGLVGDMDMNFLEMIDLDGQLQQTGMNAELRIFAGDHRWPGKKLLEGAVEWLDLQAMRKGKLTRDQKFMDSLFREYLQTAENNMGKGNLVEAVRQYRYILRDFPGDARISIIRETADSLSRSKEYVKSMKQWNDNRSWESEKKNDIGMEVLKMVENEKGADSIFNRISVQIQSIKKMQKDNNREKSNMSSRTLSYLSLYCYQAGENFYKLGSYWAASKVFATGVLIEPGNTLMLIYQARACALDNNPSESLRCLRKAVDQGFSDKEFLTKEKAFSALRNDQRFLKIISNM